MNVGCRIIACERCGHEFTPKTLGRRPLYCGRTCRQRAYEARRRAAVHHRLLTPTLTPLMAPDVIPRRPPQPPRYEGGRNRQISHALRPDGPADVNGDRPTLCGTYSMPDPVRRFFGDPRISQRPCRTCANVARRFPLHYPIDPPADLSHIKHILAGGLDDFVKGAARQESNTLLYLYRLAYPELDLGFAAVA